MVEPDYVLSIAGNIKGAGLSKVRTSSSGPASVIYFQGSKEELKNWFDNNPYEGIYWEDAGFEEMVNGKFVETKMEK